MKKWQRITLISAGTIVGLLILVLVGVLSYLKTPQAQQSIQKHLNRILPGEVTWRRLDFSLREGRVDIDDVLVEGPSRERLAGLKRFHVDVSWLALLKGRITVEEAVIENPWADLSVDENGRLNLMRAFSEPAPREAAPAEDSGGLPFDVAVDVFRLTDGAVSYRDPQAALAVSLEEISAGVEALVLSTPAGRVRLEIGKGDIKSPAFTGPLDRFQVTANLDADGLSPVDLRIAAGSTNISLIGTVAQLGADPVLDVTLDADLALAEIRQILQLGPELTGNTRLRASARGPLANPEATATLDYDGGVLGGFPVDRISLALLLADRTVKIDPLSVESYLGSLNADGEIDLKNAFPEGFLSSERALSSLGYRIALRQKGLLLEKALSGNAGYGGIIDADITLEGKGVSPGDISAQCRVALSGKGIVAPGMDRPVDVSAAARGGLQGPEAVVEQLTVDAGETRLSGSGRYHITGGGLKGAFDLSAPDLSTPLSLVGIKGVRGAVSVNALVGGTLDRPSATIGVSGEQLALPDVMLGDLRLEAGLDEAGTVDIRTLTLENQGSRATVRGRIDLLDNRPGKSLAVRPDLPVDLTLALENVEPSDFLKGKDLQGRFDGTLAVKGPLRSPEARANIAGKGLAAGPDTIGDMDVRLGFSGGQIRIDHLAVQNLRSDLAVAGTVTLLDRAMTLLDDPAFDIVIKRGHLFAGDFLEKGEGELNISGGLSGRRKDPVADLALSGRGLAFNGNRIGDVDARIRMSDGRILFAPVTVENGRSKVGVSGTIGVMTPKTGAFLEDPTLDLRLSGEHVFLEDFIDGLTGTFALSGDIGGSVARPRGAVAVNGKQLDLGGQTLDSMTLAARMDGRSIMIDRFQVAVTPKETIDGNGTIDLDRSAYEVRLSSEGVSLASIHGAGGPDQISGKVAIDVSGKGTFKDPRAEGTVSVTSIQVNRKPVADLRIRLAVKDQTARVWGHPGFDLDARYHLNKKEFSASLGFDRTELAPYFRIAGLDDLAGKIDGTIKADGRSDAPDKIRVVADLLDLTLLSGGKEFLASPRIRVRLENNAYDVSDTEIRLLKDGRINLRGRGNLAGKLAMSVDGRIPFAVIKPFLEDGNDAWGTIQLDAGLGGTLEHPEIKGNITLDRLGMILPGLEQRLHDVAGRIVLSSGALVLEKVAGRIDDGSFALGGRVDLKDLKPARLDVQVTARKLPIEVPDTLSLLLDSRLNLTGTAEKSLLKGTIILLEGRYTKDVELNLLKGITEKTREVAPEPPAGSPSFLSHMALDIIVKRREPFEVENNLANMSLSPDLRILGTAERPVISGRAKVDEGVITYQVITSQHARLDFQKTEFKILKGVVDFLNPYKTEPTIDIESEASVRDWIISLKISGTPDNLKFELTSDPVEEHADILSLLLVGKTLKELGQDNGGSGFSGRQILGDILAGTVSSGVKDATGLDIVEMEFAEADGKNGSDDIKVTLGKELSRRITVKYGAELKNGATIQKVTSEYKVLENLMVSAFQDTDGNFGGALTFRMEFR